MLFIIILVVIILIAYVFINNYPHFGKSYSKEKKQTFEMLENYSKGKFQNQIPTSMSTDLKTTYTMLRDFIKSNPSRKPKVSLPMANINDFNLSDPKEAKLRWFGHSALYIQIAKKNILIDPMFGNTPSPFPQFGGQRYSGGLPFEIEDLPIIDAVILSHDHYDHLDYRTINKIKHKVKQFIVPLGVGEHLESWGVSGDKISEHNWWDEFSLDELTIVCTPARHFSGRSINDRNASLWCSWIIKSNQHKIYFSGDSGYAPHFNEIGEKYGPFDIALMECGQYDERWSAIHMLPEETVQAFIDVKGDVLVPIHWGAFTLAFHDWYDPIERVSKAAKQKNLKISTPKIGETINIGESEFPTSIWWK